ncbi:hypothetical protein BC826DRAFT_1174874 [Russula brevipes]|nr:hypothetical protein BC826DRAFT_1174874 [Russula brevipes]
MWMSMVVNGLGRLQYFPLSLCLLNQPIYFLSFTSIFSGECMRAVSSLPFPPPPTASLLHRLRRFPTRLHHIQTIIECSASSLPLPPSSASCLVSPRASLPHALSPSPSPYQPRTPLMPAKHDIHIYIVCHSQLHPSPSFTDPIPLPNTVTPMCCPPVDPSTSEDGQHPWPHTRLAWARECTLGLWLTASGHGARARASPRTRAMHACSGSVLRWHVLWRRWEQCVWQARERVLIYTT